ncbi:MAG: sigma-70 family RNA polymerase sigma factor [Clostridia bacterium]|nr:sigma-70 family RNA polymerase sigma factor [Clostridia bacterium]
MDKIGTEKTEELIRKYSDMIYRIALHNIGNIADAEDVLQDVWFEYIKRNPQTEDEERLKAWLIRVTINKCRSLYRLFWRRNRESLEDHTELIAPEQREILEEVRSLPKDSRNIVYLYYYESYTIAEIAKILGKNQNTVSSALQRARRKLKELLEEGDEEYVK